MTDKREAIRPVIDRYRNVEFRWGKHDCAIFGADCVKAQGGPDLARGYRGKYSTMMGGIKRARKNGYNSHVDIFEKNLNEIPVAFACTGDIAIIDTADGPAIGVVDGANIFAMRETVGLTVVPLNKAIKTLRTK